MRFLSVLPVSLKYKTHLGCRHHCLDVIQDVVDEDGDFAAHISNNVHCRLFLNTCTTTILYSCTISNQHTLYVQLRRKITKKKQGILIASNCWHSFYYSYYRPKCHLFWVECQVKHAHTHPHNIHTHVSLNIRILNEKVALNCALKNYDLSIINGLVNVLVLDEPSLYLGG